VPKKEVATPQIAVIYARFSSRGQNEESIEQQIAKCEAYATANNLVVTEVYSDSAISGKTDRRPDFQKMMRHAERKQFNVVITYKSNRMGRDMLNAMMYENKLAKLGIKVVYSDEEFGDNAAGRFALRMMMNVNQFYSENMAEDIKRGLMHNAERCMITNGFLPLGYKKGADGKYALDPPNADIVREIFSRVASGEQYVEIARDLNARGIRTKQGNEWGKNSFHSILDNERYTGVYLYDKVRVEGGVPQIIEKELFLKVQDYLKSKKNPRGRKRGGGEYLLTGKLFCGKCGSPMVGKSGTGKMGKLHFYYVCKAREANKSCKMKNVRRDWAEREIANALKQLLADDEMIGKMADAVIAFAKEYRERSDIAILDSQLKETKKALANMTSAIEQGIVTETTKERLEELEAEKRRIENQLLLENAEVLDVSKDKLLKWYKMFRHGDIEDKSYQRDLINNVLIAAYVYDDHFKIDTNATGRSRKIKVPFKVINEIESGGAECSYKIFSEPPQFAQKSLHCNGFWCFLCVFC